MCGGISRLDFTDPANTPKMKNSMAGSRKLVMNVFYVLLEIYSDPHN
jgi:hypothetical protein